MSATHLVLFKLNNAANVKQSRFHDCDELVVRQDVRLNCLDWRKVVLIIGGVRKLLCQLGGVGFYV